MAMNLKEVVLNYLTDNEEAIKYLITWFLNEVMQEEAEQQAGAGRYHRTSSRKAYRNGHRKRTLKTRHGEITSNRDAGLLLRPLPRTGLEIFTSSGSSTSQPKFWAANSEVSEFCLGPMLSLL